MQGALDRLAALRDAAPAYDFFAALRLLECAHPERARIGQSLLPRDDAVRFGHPPDLAFQPAMLGKFRMGDDGAAARLDVNFLGLMGANGPLPQHVTDYVRDRLRNAGDPTLARFFDVFHHRMIALFYRAWASAQPTVSLDRAHGDRFSDYIASLAGLGMQSLRGRDAVPDFAKLHYAGHLAAHNRNAEGLARLLQDDFGVPVDVEQFVGHWMRMPADSLCRLRSGLEAQVLGSTTVLGKAVWNCQHKFRIVVGPLGLDDYRRFLPGGASFRRLRDWVANYAGMAYDWDVNVRLRRDAVPPLALGLDAGPERAVRLGWTSWLHAAAPRRDARQLVLNGTHAAHPSHHDIQP